MAWTTGFKERRDSTHINDDFFLSDFIQVPLISSMSQFNFFILIWYFWFKDTCLQERIFFIFHPLVHLLSVFFYYWTTEFFPCFKYSVLCIDHKKNNKTISSRHSIHKYALEKWFLCIYFFLRRRPSTSFPYSWRWRWWCCCLFSLKCFSFCMSSWLDCICDACRNQFVVP